MGKGERPELTAPPQIFYNEEEAQKYTSNSRMINIQTSLTQRAMELLALKDDGVPKLLLDLGCGSGLSGEVVSEQGHMWVGFDISEAMLSVAVDREVEGDVNILDLGNGLPLRRSTFDGAISISAVQWLCNADTSTADPRKRLKLFFQTLYSSLVHGARAVLQIYPKDAAQAEMMVSAAMRTGFSGGLVIDYPHSARAKKYFLVLMVGAGGHMPAGRSGNESEEDEDEDGVQVAGRQRPQKKRKTSATGSATKGRQWVFKKKEAMRKKGYEHIPPDTRYTGRKRRHLT